MAPETRGTLTRYALLRRRSRARLHLPPSRPLTGRCAVSHLVPFRLARVSCVFEHKNVPFLPRPSGAADSTRESSVRS